MQSLGCKVALPAVRATYNGDVFNYEKRLPLTVATAEVPDLCVFQAANRADHVAFLCSTRGRRLLEQVRGCTQSWLLPLQRPRPWRRASAIQGTLLRVPETNPGRPTPRSSGARDCLRRSDTGHTRDSAQSASAISWSPSGPAFSVFRVRMDAHRPSWRPPRPSARDSSGPTGPPGTRTSGTAPHHSRCPAPARAWRRHGSPNRCWSHRRRRPPAARNHCRAGRGPRPDYRKGRS